MQFKPNDFIIDLFRELVDICPIEDKTPKGRFTIAPDGSFQVRYSNRLGISHVKENGEIIEKFQPVKKSLTEARSNAYGLLDVLYDAHLIENGPGSNEELLDGFFSHKYKRNNPFKAGTNITVDEDKEGHVTLNFRSSLSRGDLGNALMQAFMIAKENNLNWEAVEKGYHEDDEFREEVDASARQSHAMFVLRKALYQKERNPRTPTLYSSDPELTAQILKDSGLFSPVHVGNLDGNLSARVKGTGKTAELDPDSFMPKDKTLKAGDFEWVMTGQEILTEIANNGGKFSGSSGFRTDKEL